jgi:hypothetical protein
MTIILSSSDTTSLSSLIICCTTMATLSCHCQKNWEPVLTYPIVSVATALGAARFSRLSTVLVAAGVKCLDAVRLRMTALLR